MNNNFLSIKDMSKSFKSIKVFEKINFSISRGEFISLLGPSGCGKTTLLRCIMGLVTPDEGQLLFEGRDITNVPVDRRGFSIVFQDYALFPHMNLYNNVAYPLKIQKLEKAKIKERVAYALNALGIEAAAKKYPHELSGGMQQRAAIARSLVMGSQLMLLDEPFSALDAMVKVDLSEELKELQRRFSITMFMVTHDQIDAVSLSDKILLMNKGKIIANDTPRNLYANCSDDFVKSFFIDQIDKRAKHMLELRM